MSERLTRAIDHLADGQDLSETDAAEALAEIMAGEATDIEIAGFLIALRVKGETIDELAGLARTMRAFAAFVPTAGMDLLDTAGTGGGRTTFNVSTTAALIAAGAGCCVAKHGSRSSTGLSGSADMLEALGARIDLDSAAVARCIEEIGFGFMFAPYHHPATGRVVKVRKELKVRTTFNFLGPLTNPAGARRQLLGVSDMAKLPKLAGALALLGTDHALLVSSEDSLDELSISAATRVIEVRETEIEEYTVIPEDFGLERHPADSVPGGDPQENARIARAIFAGEPGAARDLAVLNAGAAIYAAGRAETFAEGVELAQQAIDSGAAAAKVEAFVTRTQELAPQESPGMNVLMEIVADTRVAVARRAAAVPLPALIEAGEQRLAGEGQTRDFKAALAAPGMSLIAEHKRSSPSAGLIRADLELADVVSAYERAGARALSVLTEGSRFGGELGDLAAARAASSLPILRKDFIVDEYQVHEALAGGADAILLIVAALDTGTLIRLHSLATQLGLATLVEVHDALELDATHEIGAEIVGINNRDLTTLEVDVERTYELLGDVRDGALVVAESGFREHAQIARLQQAGVNAVLVGEALMRSAEIEAATRSLLGSTP